MTSSGITLTTTFNNSSWCLKAWGVVTSCENLCKNLSHTSAVDSSVPDTFPSDAAERTSNQHFNISVLVSFQQALSVFQNEWEMSTPIFPRWFTVVTLCLIHTSVSSVSFSMSPSWKNELQVEIEQCVWDTCI